MDVPQPNLNVSTFDLVASVAKAVDMMSPKLAAHHVRVAYLAFRIGQAAGMSAERQSTAIMAGLLHDIGAFSLGERLQVLDFEDKFPGSHSEAGYMLLKGFHPLEAVAEAIRFHHVHWKNGAGATHKGMAVPPESHLLHLADRIAVLVNNDSPVLGQVEAICARVSRHTNGKFVPELVDAFLTISRSDYIWLELISSGLDQLLGRNMPSTPGTQTLEDLIAFSKMLCRIIDFKSPFTAAHSAGVAAVAVSLALHAGFSRHDSHLVEIAAYLHDLGKLAIPVEILEKPSVLTNDEWHIMRTHVFYTYQILEPIEALKTISAWGSQHQERLNGTGYPFRCDATSLSLGSRIMAVADVFVAITEDRPYRKGMEKGAAWAVLEGMGERGELDAQLVNVVRNDFDEIDALRANTQQAARQQYQEFRASL